MKNALLILFGITVLAFVGYLVYSATNEAVYTKSDGIPVSIENDPVQVDDKETMLTPMQYGRNKYFFTVKAAYKINGILVGKRHYPRGFMSSISPYDYSLVWANMPSMLPYIKFSNTYRFCLYSYKDTGQVDKKYVETHMSNSHMIPSTKNIRRALKTVRKGNLVEIEGYLVNVMENKSGKGTSNWKTSTKRTDTGNGACEIIYVKRLRIGDRIYE
jgi:hypothetical protein